MAKLFKSIGELRKSGIPVVTSAQAAGLIEDADLFFCCGTDPAAVAIHLVTGSPISHTGWLCKEGAELRTIESTFTDGVHLGYGDGYLNMGDGACIIARLKGITAVQAEAILVKADSQIGKRYEIGEEIEMALHAFAPFMRCKPEWDQLFCSGLVQCSLEGTEWAIPNDKSGGNATPVDVWTQPFIVPVCAVVP